MAGPQVFVLFNGLTQTANLGQPPDIAAVRCIQVSSLTPLFLGELEEVRVSATLRPTSFVAAERQTAEDDFVMQGDVQMAFQ